MDLRSPVVHQEVPGVLHTVVQLLICCGLPWELLRGPEEPKGGVLASPWRPTGPSWSPLVVGENAPLGHWLVDGRLLLESAQCPNFCRAPAKLLR